MSATLTVDSCPVVRRASVLVVDDEAMVGAAVGRALRQLDVTLVQSAGAALAYLAANPPPDVILCDLMMPEMSGMEFHDELTRVRPELIARVVFMTGGAFTPAASKFLASIPNVRLGKPFDAKDLRAVVEATVR